MTLTRISKLSGVPLRTLQRWRTTKPFVFEAVCEKVNQPLTDSSFNDYDDWLYSDIRKSRIEEAVTDVLHECNGNGDEIEFIEPTVICLIDSGWIKKEQQQ